MKKWTITVPTFVFVSATIEAETEEEAYEASEGLEFGMEYSPSMGGGAFPRERDMDLEVGEPDFDNMTSYEVTE